MAFGDVFYHETTQAIGKGLCWKFQLHIADEDFSHPNLLLFISTDDYYKRDVPIARNPDHRFLDYDSYISLGTVVELERLRFDAHVGVLSPTMYGPLLDAAKKVRVMERKTKLLHAMQVAYTLAQISALPPRRPLPGIGTQTPIQTHGDPETSA